MLEPSHATAAMAAMAPPPECPPGYRLLQPEDVAVNKDVLYISRDPTKPPRIQTQILDTTITGDRINLLCKTQANMNRVFVPDTAAVGAQVQAADVAEATEAGGNSVDAGSNGAGNAQGSAEGGGSVGEAGADADADKFLRYEVVAWMESLEAVGPTLPEALEAALDAVGKTPECLVTAFKAKVPWQPCVNFQAVPRFSKQRPLAHFDVVISKELVRS